MIVVECFKGYFKRRITHHWKESTENWVKEAYWNVIKSFLVEKLFLNRKKNKPLFSQEIRERKKRHFFLGGIKQREMFVAQKIGNKP